MSLRTFPGINNDEEPSDIQKFFKDSCIFITGGSGFLGHLLIQKLMRDCPDLSKLYVLIRPKKQKSLEERFEMMLENPVFGKMKTEFPKYREKIKLISGDLEKQDLGLSEADKILLSKEVDVIFHLAATVRFTEKIKTAAALNVRGTRDVIQLAKSMPNLKAFLYCSTAYSNCVRKEIDEVFYNMPHSPDRLLQVTEILKDNELETLTPNLIGDWPNTYVFTKGLVENLVRDEGQGLPITIVRPSMVLTTVNDPLEGWINNVYGPAGSTCGVGAGLIRVGHTNKELVGDVVPGDYVVNNMIAAAYYIGTTFKKNNNEDNNKNRKYVEHEIKLSNNMPIFNCISSSENPITWDDMGKFGSKMLNYATIRSVWYAFIIFEPNPYLYKFYEFVLHTIPAYLVDFILRIRGKEPRMLKIYQKIHSFGLLVSYFSLREWTFKNNNNQALWKNLNHTDKRIFPFSLKELDWKIYFTEQYPKGLRLYIFKDPMETLPRALKKHQRLKYLHYTVVFMFCLIFAIILLKIFSIFV